MYYINQIGFIMIVTWGDTCHVTQNITTSCPCISQEILVTWHTMSLLPVRVYFRKYMSRDIQCHYFLSVYISGNTCHVTNNVTTSCPCIFQEILVTWHTMSLLPVRVCSRKSPWSRDYGFYRCFTPSRWPSTCFLYSTRVHSVRFQYSNTDTFILKTYLVFCSYT